MNFETISSLKAILDTTTTEPMSRRGKGVPFSPKLARAALQRRSGWFLLMANLAVIPATTLFDWNVFDLVFLYWAENVVIGVFNVLRMLAAGIGGGPSTLIPNLATMFFMVPFFAVHYGGFCYGHLIFVMALLDGAPNADQDVAASLSQLLQGPLGWALILLTISHGYSLVVNFLRSGEYRRILLPALMLQPYGRIIVLHITILLGALVAQWLGDPLGILLVLIALKTTVDLAMHERERQRMDAGPEANSLKFPHEVQS